MNPDINPALKNVRIAKAVYLLIILAITVYLIALQRADIGFSAWRYKTEPFSLLEITRWSWGFMSEAALWTAGYPPDSSALITIWAFFKVEVIGKHLAAWAFVLPAYLFWWRKPAIWITIISSFFLFIFWETLLSWIVNGPAGLKHCLQDNPEMELSLPWWVKIIIHLAIFAIR